MATTVFKAKKTTHYETREARACSVPPRSHPEPPLTHVEAGPRLSLKYVSD